MDGFEILEKLGDGSYSIVYKVKRKEDSNIYALKKVKLKGLSDKEKQNALNEVRILASVKSPFVISYKEAFIEDETETLCIVMEYADKGDLYQKIVHFKKIGCLIEEIDAWKIFIQMTRGLKSLHDLKILHRDLKAANIFLFSDGTAKIGDLNVSKVARRGVGYTQTGTPYYASPEVWKEEVYDNKSDIWSLGCVTYEMLTLHPPFRGKDMEDLYNKVIKGQYKRIGKNYSEDMNEIINFLLKVNPKDRPNCDEILKHPIVKKRLEFFQAQAGETENFEDMDEGVLLKTIRIPNNIIFLGEKLPEKNYEKAKSHSKAMGKSIVKKIAQNQNTSLPNIKILNQLKSPPIKTVQPKKGNAIFEDNKNININTKNIKKENSNLSVSKNNQKKAGNLICKEKISISKSPELISLKRNKYEEEYLHKNNLDIIQLERRKLYGNNINNKRQKINNYYNAYLPIYRNNKYYNYGINNKLSNESYKYGGIFPSIFNNKSLGGVNYSSNNKVIANRRLNPIITKKSLVKINI
jgi:NIMA (never in mitosis gene a)-related kinase